MPEDRQYKIVFYGRILEGLDVGEVKKRLAALLKADSKKIDRLFTEAPITIKKDIDYPTASKFKEQMRAAGAVCEIERTAGETAEVKPPPLVSRSQPPVSADIRTAAAASAAPTIRPAKIWYIIAVLLLFVPGMVAGIKMAVTIFSHLTSGIEFTAPGVTEVTVSRPDNYIIWYTTDDGRSYHREIPQDIKITVYDQRLKRFIEVTPPKWDSKETVANVKRQSIAEIVIDRPGIYKIEVSGNFPESDLIWRRSLLADFFTNFVLPILVGLLGFGAGLTMAVVVFVKRSKHRYRADPAALSKKEERQWAMFSHIGTFAAFVVPFGNIIAPLIIWQIKKDESSFVAQHSKESLNFQISLMIYSLASTLLVLLIIGIFLLIGLLVFNIIAVIIAGVGANEGEHYRYPMTIRFFK
ncbi:MAG: DUF4870 domain-containing protein [Desulfobacterales bacterium]|nr:MAG: DUF4870 domain-containing protein [Desulfobacterales bacterium]